MTRYIKTKDGKFAGSIGEGKTRIPQPAPKPFEEQTISDDELAGIGLGAYIDAFVAHTSRPTSVDDAYDMLTAMDEHMTSVPDSTEEWIDTGTICEPSCSECWLEQGTNVAAVRDDLHQAHLHLDSLEWDIPVEPSDVEAFHRDRVRARLAGVVDSHAQVSASIHATSTSSTATGMELLDKASQLLSSPEYRTVVDNTHDATDRDLAYASAAANTARMYVRQAAASNSAASVLVGSMFTLPEGTSTMSSATALQEEIGVTQRALEHALNHHQDTSDPRWVAALGRIRSAHARIHDLPWEA